MSNGVARLRELLLDKEQREIGRTGIPTLKVAFNNVFGYYIEVTSKWKDQVPAEWTRKQTIANGERYITQDLKTMESRILGAEERATKLEYDLFLKVREEVRTAALDNVRRAKMIIKDQLEDPNIEAVKNVYYRGPAPHDGDG